MFTMKNRNKGSRNLHKQLSDTDIIFSSGVHLTLIMFRQLSYSQTANMKCTVTWIHTMNGGSCPLLVMYNYCASVSEWTWYLILDHLTTSCVIVNRRHCTNFSL